MLPITYSILLTKIFVMKPATVVNETSVDWDATQDEHMGLPRKTARKVIPPKRLGDYV